MQWEAIDDEAGATTQHDTRPPTSSSSKWSSASVAVSPQALLILDAVLSERPRASYYHSVLSSDTHENNNEYSAFSGSRPRFLRVYSPVRKYLRQLYGFWLQSPGNCPDVRATATNALGQRSGDNFDDESPHPIQQE